METKLLHSFTSEEKNSIPQKQNLSFSKIKYPVLALILGITLGSLTGILLVSFNKKQPLISNIKTSKKKLSAGVKNEKLFPDSAEGILREGGIDGEGNYHLERPGGESQNVYLTSSTVDLSQFLNKKVKVWGKTYKGEKAGWLMDVGYIEIVK